VSLAKRAGWLLAVTAGTAMLGSCDVRPARCAEIAGRWSERSGAATLVLSADHRAKAANWPRAFVDQGQDRRRVQASGTWSCMEFKNETMVGLYLAVGDESRIHEQVVSSERWFGRMRLPIYIGDPDSGDALWFERDR
jgi:hypothetical protein